LPPLPTIARSTSSPWRICRNSLGYVLGGVTALAAERDYPLYADEKIGRFETISISAGIRGLQTLLAAKDYLKVRRAYVAAIALREES